MGRLVRLIDQRFYPGYGDNWDDELLRGEILRALGADSRVLDLGAGAGIVGQMNFAGKAARICGIDPDRSVLRNPHLDEAKIAGGESIPYEGASFDLVFADNVLEHLPDPAAVFREVARVLVPGGLFLVKTPNRRHYVSLIARSTPHSFHEWLNRKRGRAASDTFPTLYRANSAARLSRCARAAGLSIRRISFHEGRPEYLRLWGPTYLAGLLYERLVNAFGALAGFRVVIIGIFQKPRDAGGRPGD